MKKIDETTAIALINTLAVNGNTMSYQAFAQKLNITTSPIIKTVTSFLEELVIHDVNSQKLIRASVIVQKGDVAIPRQGFFAILHKLGRTKEELTGDLARQWHTNECNQLKAVAKDNNELT